MVSHQTSILQVFNRYMEKGGEEIWADQLPQLLEGRVDVRDLRFYSGDWKAAGAPGYLTQALRLWRNPESMERLRERVAETRPDALLFHNIVPVGSLALYEQAEKLSLPVIQYTHNFRPFSPSGTLWVRGRVNESALQGNPWPEVFAGAWEGSVVKTLLLAFYQGRLIESGNLGVVRRWVTISEFMRRHFIASGLPKERVVLLRHCWRPRFAGPCPDDGGYYLFLGRLVPEKGVRTLLEAWRRLELCLGNACPLLVIAGRGPLDAEVIEASQRMDRVAHVGFIEGGLKQDLLSRARAVIAPSIWHEPLGLIVYEAYDAGKPVLAAASGGLTETVDHGRTGYQHPPGDADVLARDVERLEDAGPKQRREMGREGRRWLERHADPDHWAEQFAAITLQAAT